MAELVMLSEAPFVFSLSIRKVNEAECCSGIERFSMHCMLLPSKIIPKSAVVVWNKLP